MPCSVREPVHQATHALMGSDEIDINTRIGALCYEFRILGEIQLQRTQREHFNVTKLYTICWSIAVTRLAAGIITWLFETLVQLQSDWTILHTNLATSCLTVSNVEISYLILSGTKSAYNQINMRVLKFSAVYMYHLSIYVRCFVWDFDCMHNI